MMNRRSDDDSFMQRHSVAAILAAAATSVVLSACGEVGAGSGATRDSVETVKSAVVIANGAPPGHALDYYQCATEGGSCAAMPGTYLAYGASSFFIFKKATAVATPCNTVSFGGDPISSLPKACYRSNFRFTVAQHGTSSASGGREVAYGAFGRFNFAKVFGSYLCDDSTFGDPIVGYAKDCYDALPDYAAVAQEGGTLTGLGTSTPVAYGAGGAFEFRLVTGSIGCNNDAFGRDPAYGFVKTCYKVLPPFTTAEPNTFADLGGAFYKFGSGANGNFISKAFNGNGFCTVAGFGGDPDVGHPKYCYGPQ
jgi:hypothetical protein